MTTITIGRYLELNALQSIVSTGVTSVTELVTANPDFSISINVPSSYINTLYFIKQFTHSQTIIANDDAISALHDYIFSLNSSTNDISFDIIGLPDLSSSPALYFNSSTRLPEIINITQNSRTKYFEDQTFNGFINDLISSKIIYTLKGQIADPDGFNILNNQDSPITEDELNLMLHRINQDIQICITDFLKNNGDAIFSAASTHGKTSILNGFENSLLFTSGDSIQIPIRINLNPDNDGIASLRLGMARMNTHSDFLFSNNPLNPVHEDRVLPGITSRIHLYSDSNVSISGVFDSSFNLIRNNSYHDNVFLDSFVSLYNAKPFLSFININQPDNFNLNSTNNGTLSTNLFCDFDASDNLTFSFENPVSFASSVFDTVSGTSVLYSSSYTKYNSVDDMYVDSQQTINNSFLHNILLYPFYYGNITFNIV